MTTSLFRTDGRLNIRPSGAEPLVRALVETAGMQHQTQRTVNQFEYLLAKEI